MIRIACLQNHPAEGPARIADWAKDRGHDLTVFRAFAGEFPSSVNFDALVIMGGPMSVHDADKDVHINGAIHIISQFVDDELPTLGICLGAQMLATIIGGRVVRGIQKEIGWYPVKFTENAPAGLAELDSSVFHWHGECMQVPRRAEVFASTPACSVQGFRLPPSVIGLQFHLEVDAESLRGMTTAFANELREGGKTVQDEGTILMRESTAGPPCEKALYALLDEWIGS